VAASCSLTCLSPCAIIWTTSLMLPMAALQRLYDEATVMRMAEAFGGPAERSAVGAAKDGIFFLKKEKIEKSFKIEKADQ